MDNNDLKKWLTEQVSYLEKTKEQPEKFAWDPEYDLQLAAFRLAIEALHGTCNHFREVTKMVPLTLKQLQEMNGEPVWITSVKKDGKIPSRWVLYSGKSESRDREDVYVFATTGGIAQGYNGAAYGKTWLAYDYQPARSNRRTWVSVNERNADAAEEYFSDLLTFYRKTANDIFRRDNEGRQISNQTYSAEYQKWLGMQAAMREVLEYFSKYDLGERNEEE